MSKAIWARLFLLAFLWGSEFLFVKIALRAVDPISLVLLRLSLAAIVLYAVIFSRRESLPRERAIYGHCAFLGFFATLLPYFLMGWAQQRISSALTGILVGAGPLLTALLATRFLPHDRLTPVRVAGLAIGITGVVIVMHPWDADIHGDLAGSIAALGVALGFAIGYVYNVRFLTSHRASGPLIMALQTTFGAVLAGLLLLVSPERAMSFDTPTLTATIVLGAINTGVAAIVFFSLLRSAGAVATSLVEYLMVVVAVVLGVTFLDEELSWLTIFGVVVILSGVALTERRPKNAPSAKVEAP